MPEPAVALPQAAATAPPAASQPRPLQLDLRPDGARAARGGLRHMADAAGADLGDAPGGATQRLEEDIARAGKSDCIGPNAHGSLLSAVFIAIDAARGRCK